MFKKHTFNLAVAASVAVFLGIGADPACASIIVSLQESGANVVATASGSANLDGLTASTTTSFSAFLNPSFLGTVAFGALGGTTMNRYVIPIGASSLGSGSGAVGSLFSGQAFAFNGGNVYFPSSYVSQTSFSSTATWAGKTLAGLGLNTGTYSYSWGSGPTADSISLTVGAVPEPEEYAAVAGGLCLAVAAWRRCRRTVGSPR